MRSHARLVEHDAQDEIGRGRIDEAIETEKQEIEMMFFRRKAKNRRFEREHVLDVKMHSRHVRALRVRIATTIAAIVIGGGVSVFFLWRTAEWLVDACVYRNDVFAIRALDFHTDGILSLDEIRRWAGVNVGTNLLALDLARIRRDLELRPWIEHAAIERVLPDKLRIHVSEREPIARIAVFEPRRPDGFELRHYFADANGFIMDSPATPPSRDAWIVKPEDLPVITGFDRRDVRPGSQVRAEPVQAALRLVREFERSPMLGQVDLRNIDVGSPQILVVTTLQGGEITFGQREFPDQLRRWRIIHDYAHTSSKAIGFLDLSVPNNLPARWIESASVPPPKPKPLKPSRTRKKHA